MKLPERIVIVGCGRVGSELAVSLSERGRAVAVIDIEPTAFQRLGSTFEGSTHQGLAYDVGVMRDAGIDSADVFVAVTDSDNANAMAALVAKRVFGVPVTIARLNDPAREETYRVLEVKVVPEARLTSRAIQQQIDAAVARHSG